jgi:hypothetical protein
MKEAVTEIKSRKSMHSKEGYVLERILYADNSVEFVLSNESETCQTRGSGKEGIKEVLETWRDKLSKMDKANRNEKIKSIQNDHKDMLAEEGNPQEKLSFNETDGEGDEE